MVKFKLIVNNNEIELWKYLLMILHNSLEQNIYKHDSMLLENALECLFRVIEITTI